MEIIKLEQTKGTFETLVVLLKKGNKRPTHLIESIVASRDTFYTIAKKLEEYDLIEKQYDKAQNALVWTLTTKGRKVAELLMEMEKNLTNRGR